MFGGLDFSFDLFTYHKAKTYPGLQCDAPSTNRSLIYRLVNYSEKPNESRYKTQDENYPEHLISNDGA